MADRSVAYDLATETAHQLNHSAGELLAVCDGVTRFDRVVDAWAEAGRSDPAEIASGIEVGLAEFERLGLIVGGEAPSSAARTEQWVQPDPLSGAPPSSAVDGWLVGATHRVIDHGIAFRSTDQELLKKIDEHLGTGRDIPAPTMFFDVDADNDGGYLLRTNIERWFPTLDALLDRLATVINEYAVWTHSCASIHAGAVRAPAVPDGVPDGHGAGGEIILLPGHSGHGKSTLTAALVASGWDYLGDEAIGVRAQTHVAVGYPKRLSLSSSSRAALGLGPTQSSEPEVDDPTGRPVHQPGHPDGQLAHQPAEDPAETQPEEIRAQVVRLDGDVGPITRVVLPRFVDGAAPTLERLRPTEAVVEIMANALNLARCGQVGLAAICDLAAEVPTYRLTHGDALAAAELIAREVLAGGVPDDGR